MKKSTILATFLLSAIGLSNPTIAEEGVTGTIGIGQMNFDSDRNLDDDTLGNVGIGYRFDSPWATEFSYLSADTETDPGGVDIDASYWRLDGLYHFAQRNKLEPFVAFGAGHSDIDGLDNDDSGGFTLNAGGGAKYWFAPSTALRGDLRFFRTMDDSEVDTALIVGLHHHFGGRSTPAAPAPAEPAGPVDSDGDGVMDDQDACPNTPCEASVDSRGCAIDTDGDGVPDYKDACPGTSQRGARIDSRGCYEMLKETVSVELNVQFDFDSAAARPEHRAEVKRVYDFMREYPQTKVTIEGHTDSRGSADYNKDLSQRRADTIAEMLTTDFSLSSDRVSAVGYGEERPIASNETDEGRQANRRVVGVVEANVESIRQE